MATTDRRLFFLLQKATRVVIGHANALTHEALGVSATQLATLSHLAKHPGSTMTAIAALFDLNKSAVSGMISRLERAGLVERATDPSDGRANRVSLTAKGEAVRVASLPIVRRATAEATEGFTAAEIDVVFRFLNGLVDRYAEVPQRRSADDPEG